MIDFQINYNVEAIIFNAHYCDHLNDKPYPHSISYVTYDMLHMDPINYHIITKMTILWVPAVLSYIDKTFIQTKK